MSQGHRRDRKKRRLLYGAAAAVVATATIGTIAVASPGVLGSSDDKGGGESSLQSQFAAAAEEFDVPKSVLMAVSYRQTRWESHDGEPSTTGAYNVMGLTKVDPEDLESEADDHRLEHMNRSGKAEIEKTFDAAKALRSLPKETVDTDDPRLHTLDKAAELIDSSTDSLQKNTSESIRAGAALLADYQNEATGNLPDDPGAWYPAVARYSQSPDKKGSDLFAQRVFESIKTGEVEVTTDGERVVLPADPSVQPVKPSNVPLAASFASTTDAPAVECPVGLNCNFVASPTFTAASRPDGQGVSIRQIVIHDTEGGYAGSLAALTNPATKASAHYLIRASDGLVTQLVENKNLAWHGGNWTLNMHSIGVEHEGYAIKGGGGWYTEPQYESSAALVKFLAAKYGIPVDRQHIIGHDEIGVQLDSYISKTHWDPGPFWDWNRFMAKLGAPTGAGGAGGLLRVGQVVRVVPPFTTANQPTLTYYDDASKTNKTAKAQPANFGYLYSSPSTSAATITDPYFSALWSQGSNWANKVRAGGTYVVAETQGDWTAIWYAGQKAWFRNPGGQFTVPVTSAPTQVKAKAGVTVKIYGRAYPETAAYTAAGLEAPTDNPNYLSKYKFTTGASGVAYAKAGPAVKGDDWFGSAQKNVIGNDVYIPIQYHHRLAWVKASEVQEVPGTAPVTSTNRYNLLARDASGVLWQYQGTGSASAPFLTRYRVGAGWNMFNAVTPMTALRADGTGDMVARDAAGILWYYKGTGNPSAPFKARLKTGAGWGAYDKIVGTRDLNGDTIPDLIAREKSGVLWFYKGTGNPAVPFAARTKVGAGWQAFNQLVSTGDLNADGKADLIARDAAGVLWFYKGTGSATTPFAPRTKVGAGWQAYNQLVGPSDLNGDGKVDLIARDTTGALWYYKGTGSATAPYATRTKVGSGWQIYNLIF
ncbi:N-acetylmuramoyl-L-alanine amidase [Streptomyces sp. NPDC058579]|uniref:N-acetylmuramoyl-L-alanine amidase n=1 Tax=Streptomyces sp. NPDC058579 TaxID=3346548 RepID=UPI0036662353